MTDTLPILRLDSLDAEALQVVSQPGSSRPDISGVLRICTHRWDSKEVFEFIDETIEVRIGVREGLFHRGIRK